MDHGLNQIQKRVDNRVTHRRTPALVDQEAGYQAFWEVARDLDGLVDVVWVSGSRKCPGIPEWLVADIFDS